MVRKCKIGSTLIHNMRVGQGSTVRLKAGAADLSGQAPDGKGGDKSLQRVEVEMANGDKDVTLTDDCGTAAGARGATTRRREDPGGRSGAAMRRRGMRSTSGAGRRWPRRGCAPGLLGAGALLWRLSAGRGELAAGRPVATLPESRTDVCAPSEPAAA